MIDKMHPYCPQIMSVDGSGSAKTNAAPAGSDGCLSRPSIP